MIFPIPKPHYDMTVLFASWQGSPGFVLVEGAPLASLAASEISTRPFHDTCILQSVVLGRQLRPALLLA